MGSHQGSIPITRHPIDPFKTGKDIANECFAKVLKGKVAPGEDPAALATRLVDALHSEKCSVVPIQQGELSQLLDSLQAVEAKNDKLEEKIEGFADIKRQIEALRKTVLNLMPQKPKPLGPE